MDGRGAVVIVPAQPQSLVQPWSLEYGVWALLDCQVVEGLHVKRCAMYRLCDI